MGYKFVDEAVIEVRSGHGGPGAVSFRREKFVPLGGPDGGDGGRGGDVIVRADAQLTTLLDYKFLPRQFAGNGKSGGGNRCSGKAGADKVLRVPLGTILYRDDTGARIADVDKAGMELIVAKGGRGGKGNNHFKNSVRQTPRFAQPGEEGQEFKLRMELKILADVGLVGYPNVGKSSLISKVSAARPKIADYPFTTLEPNLGVVGFGDGQHFVVADVPGLVVGAHQGAGLGTRFLKHVERVSRIVHLVTVTHDTERDPIADFEAIEKEMKLYDKKLAKTPRVLVLNQMDLDYVQAVEKSVRSYAKKKKIPYFAISAATGAGVPELINHLGEAISKARQKAG